MTELARKLRITDYFSLGWGTMVGVGWLVVMDDWLTRGGPLGGILGFLIGGLLLLPIGYVYGKLVMAMPDAAGEVAYTARVFPRPVSYFTGWMMMLAYFIVCPWEAVAVGRIAAYIFPALDSVELYRVAGKPVYLPHLAIGLGLTGLLDSAQLSRGSFERDFSELDHVRNAGVVRRVRWDRSYAGIDCELSSAVHAHAVHFDPAGVADRSLFHDRV